MMTKQEALEWYVQWCEMGQKAHAWYMVQELERECPWEYAGLPALLKETMLKKAPQKSSEQSTGSGG